MCALCSKNDMLCSLEVADVVSSGDMFAGEKDMAPNGRGLAGRVFKPRSLDVDSDSAAMSARVVLNESPCVAGELRADNKECWSAQSSCAKDVSMLRLVLVLIGRRISAQTSAARCS